MKTMKNRMVLKWTAAGMLSVSVMLTQARAQTTLSGDHIVTGDLAVGTTATNGNLSVVGDSGFSGSVTVEGTTWLSKINGTGTTQQANDTLLMGDEFGQYGNFFLDRAVAGGCIILGYNSPRGPDPYSSFQIYNNSTDLLPVIFVFSKGDSGGDDSVSFYPYGSGNVSIGGLSPAATLDVTGDIASSGWTALGGGLSVGAYSFSVGPTSVALSAQSVVIGRYNAVTGTEDAEEWVESDPLFVIGNGTGNPSDPPEVENRNAWTVYKNGKIKMERQGDILMWEFGE